MSHRRVIDAGAAEPFDPLGLELPPAGPGRHHHRPRENVLPVVEIDPHQALGAVSELDDAMEARQHGIEAPRLKGGVPRQVGPRYATREPEIVLDPGTRPGLSTRSPCFG